MQFAYLAVLMFSLFGMAILDKRYHLALFYNRNQTLITVAVGVFTFILWDILGISLGIFFSGNSPYMSGLYLAPEFPVEELFFLAFLCYFTLVLYRFLETTWQRT